jgi:hypothetical protein
MIEVQLPDGSIGEFPDGMSDGEIQSVLQKQFPPTGEQGYIEQISKGSPQRQSEMRRISSQFEQGEISAPEYALQNFGEAAGNIGDVAGRGIGDAFGLIGKAIPQSAKDTISQYTQPIGQAIAPIIQKTGEFYGDVKQAYPRAIENVEAGANIALLGAGGLPRRAAIQATTERAGKSIGQKFLPKPKELSADDLKQTAQSLYKIADEKGGVLKPEITNKFVTDVYKELPQTEIGQAVMGETPATKLTQRLQSVIDKPMSLNAAQEVDEALGDLAYKSINPVTGELDKEGYKFLNMQSKFRDAIEKADESMVVGGKDGFNTLNDARQYWATSLRLADIEKAIQKGANTEQPQTGIKNQFKALLNSKKIGKYSPAEVRAIEVAANKGTLTDILGNFGSRLNPQITGGAAFIATADPLTGLGVFLGQSAASMGARKMATKIQLNKAKQVENLIRQRVGDTSGQKFQFTPELKGLMTELGIASLPAGGVSELLNQLQMIQQTGTIPSEEK